MRGFERETVVPFGFISGITLIEPVLPDSDRNYLPLDRIPDKMFFTSAGHLLIVDNAADP